MKNQTSRRNFLGAAAGIAGLSALELEPASAAIEPAPWGLKLGSGHLLPARVSIARRRSR